MMKHEDIKKLLSAYSSGDLQPVERAWVEEHLSSCPACRAEVAELKTALRLIRSTPDVEQPSWLTSRIMTNIVEQPAPQTGWLRRLFSPLQTKLSLEIVALLLISVTGYYLVREPDSGLYKVIQQLQRSLQQTTPPTPPSSGDKQTSTATDAADGAKTGAGIVQTEQRQGESAIRSSGESTPAVTTEPPASRTNPPAYREKKSNPSQDYTTDAKSANKKSLESAAPAPVQTFSSQIPATEPAKARISLIMGLDSLSAKTVRQALNRSGGTVLPVAAVLADRQMKARIPASKMDELLGQLEKMARIVERPVVSQSAATVEIDILW